MKQLLLKVEKNTESHNPKSFILDLWAAVFEYLRWISIFQIIPTRLKRNPAFIDGWVISNSLLALILLISVPAGHAWSFIPIFYCALRVFEVIVYQVNVLVFDQYRSEKRGERYRLIGRRRLLILSLHNFIEVVLWFAFIYHQFYNEFSTSTLHLGKIIGALYFSIITIATVGYGDIHPKSSLGACIVMAQVITGFILTILILSRFLSILPVPDSADDLERKGN